MVQNNHLLRLARGFTLVEIGITLGLLAILMTIALPMYGGWRDRIKIKQAQDDIIAMSMVLDTQLLDTGALPANLAAIGRGGLLDPWGRPYAYLNLMSTQGNGQARKDHSLVPLNTDYDLYSSGPDGASSPPLTARSSRDDIIRANTGRYIGPAAGY